MRRSKRSVTLSSSSTSTSIHGITPMTGMCRRSSSIFSPGSRIFTSPRNLLMTTPLMRLCSFSGRSFTVPYSAANTPPGLMSPMRITGASAASAMAMFTMSPFLRLISAGLPAPSMTTASYPLSSSS